ncbi:flagellin [Pontibacillus yanchengensis]|uniref:Flagellin n=1 Tax=Pontibacillus yanchengensis Y32 TaxID=1385514 RepID=A0A0A2TDC5_9BACI|nr:flagellin [Pontibacillus yanchengensis]KGP73564.1 flagellin [Pontibacillus yanchengensis Y32]
MRINHNIAALNTHRQLSQANNANQQSMEKLSSGLRINRAGDDAAGLAISEKMRGQIRGLEQASRNAQDGISMIQTAEGALNETHSILQRTRELAVQASNDTNTSDDRKEIQNEISQLVEEVDRIADDTEFNTQSLLDGSISKSTSDQGTVLEYQGTMNDGTGSAAVTATSLTSLTDANGNSLGLTDGDTIDIEVAINGSVTSTSQAVTASTTVGDLMAAVTGMSSSVTSGAISSGDLSFTGDNGVSNAINSIQMSADDGSGNERTSFNKFMSNVKETQSAQNVTSDDSRTIQIGANSDQSLSVDINNMSSNALGIGSIDVSSQQGADVAIEVVDDAIKQVSEERSKLGAYQNRLDHTINNLNTSGENLTAAESRIRDVDMAKEMMNQTKQNILSQASQSMLAKANQQPQGVLQLLR